MSNLPALSADLILVHPPAFFDFRHRGDIYFPFLGTSGDVPITPLYEYFPIGFKALETQLAARGYVVRIINLSSLLIRYPHLGMATIAEALDAPLVGIDLHWMVHVQGSLEVARQIKALRPDIRIIFGGISASFYAEELIAYDCIDMVMRGYDTIMPMERLLGGLARGEDLGLVPNLVWKTDDGSVRVNALEHLPSQYDCSVDWSTMPPAPPGRKGLPISEVMSSQSAGCRYNCGWCGGSREAFRRIYGRKRLVTKPRERVEREMNTLRSAPGHRTLHYYSVGSYNESKRDLESFIDQIAGIDLKSISYEQFFLTPEAILRKMVAANRRTSISLSPDSHDPEIARLSGRGVYTNDEMETWIEKALELGITQIDIWYLVGMPKQDVQSVFETVAYCRKLLKRFEGSRVNPMICPMIPFLDPASTFFEYPDRYGYRLFHRSAGEHARAMTRASIINRMNYETECLSREEIVLDGFEATRRLMEAKGEYGYLPSSVLRSYIDKIDDAIGFVREVHRADSLARQSDRDAAIADLSDEILRRNNEVIFGGVANQAFPVNREIGGRWCDEFGWDFDVLDRLSNGGP